MRSFKKKIAVAVAAAVVSITAVPVMTATSAHAGTTINYWLWDSNQQPAYQACADAFQAKTGITVKVNQAGWGDYWNTIQTSLATGDGKVDVFTDHLAYYQTFLNAKQIVDISAGVKAAGVDTNQYQPGLVDVWGKNGGLYGLPKDFDTIALAVNSNLATKAGFTANLLKTLRWNPTDGGTYTHRLKKLTVDKNGNNALSSKFDKNNVVTYGLSAPDPTDAWGQTYWSGLAASNGFKYLDKNPWGTHYFYDSPKLAQVFDWIAKGIAGGWIMDPKKVGSLGKSQLFQAKKIATSIVGDWEVGGLITIPSTPVAFYSQPSGPSGVKTMFNGLADSISAKSSNQAADLQWVLFTGSTACQDIVASKHIVFPAIKTSTLKAFAAFKAAGVDLSGFTNEVKPGVTFIPPMAENQPAVSQALTPFFTKIFSGQVGAQAGLTDANKAANAALAG